MRPSSLVPFISAGLLLLAAPAGAMTCSEAQSHTVWLCESLATGAGAAENFGGGSFTGSGFLIADNSESKLHWDLGQQLDRGHVEVVIENLSLESLQHANQHLIELFSDGGHWDSERAINVRAYGDDGPDEWGDLKLKIWDNPAALVAETRYTDYGWDGGAHLWSIDWDPTVAVLAVDGVPLITLDLTGMDTRMGHLWLPLHDWTADYSGVAGTLYRDLILAADPAEEIPDVPGGDTTITGNVLTTVAVDDTCGIGGDFGNTVLGAEPEMTVSGDDAGGNLEVTYLRFLVAGTEGNVTSAKVRLHTPNDPSSEGGGGTIYMVTDTGWNEETLTWNNRPPTSGGPLSSLGTVAPDSVYELDVTSAVPGDGAWSFAIVSTDPNSSHYSTKEAGLGVAPVLEVGFDPSASDDDTTPPADDDTTPSSDDDTSPTGDDDDNAADDDIPNGDDYTGACSGCAAGSLPPAKEGLAGLFLLLRMAGVRRVRRRPQRL